MIQTTDERLENALKEIEKLKALADSCNQELQHFVYAASHDLQEPLRAVTTYSQLLERMYADDEQAKELTAFIVSGVARMNELLQNLVSYSRIGASKTRAEVRLMAPLQAALYKLSAEVKETGARIHFDALPTVQAHEVQMGQLFENLLRNSLLFRSAATPEVRFSSEEGDEGYVISVADNGVGIEPKFHQQVLLPFKRLCGKEVPGNGLGLAICDKIVKAHDGRLWIESDGKTGTTVKFILPY